MAPERRPNLLRAVSLAAAASLGSTGCGNILIPPEPPANHPYNSPCPASPNIAVLDHHSASGEASNTAACQVATAIQTQLRQEKPLMVVAVNQIVPLDAEGQSCIAFPIVVETADAGTFFAHALPVPGGIPHVTIIKTPGLPPNTYRAAVELTATNTSYTAPLSRQQPELQFPVAQHITDAEQCARTAVPPDTYA